MGKHQKFAESNLVLKWFFKRFFKRFFSQLKRHPGSDVETVCNHQISKVSCEVVRWISNNLSRDHYRDFEWNKGQVAWVGSLAGRGWLLLLGSKSLKSLEDPVEVPWHDITCCLERRAFGCTGWFICSKICVGLTWADGNLTEVTVQPGNMVEYQNPSQPTQSGLMADESPCRMAVKFKLGFEFICLFRPSNSLSYLATSTSIYLQ